MIVRPMDIFKLRLFGRLILHVYMTPRFGYKKDDPDSLFIPRYLVACFSERYCLALATNYLWEALRYGMLFTAWEDPERIWTKTEIPPHYVRIDWGIWVDPDVDLDDPDAW